MSSTPTKSSPPSSLAPPSPPPPPPSTLNIVMLYMTLLGIGAIGGYGAFHVLFHERCHQIMHATETRHKASREELRKKYVSALEGQRQCMSDTSIKTELHQLQGKLEAQNVLADKHHDLLSKQEDTMSQLTSATQEKDRLSQTLDATYQELERVQQSLKDMTRNVHELSVQKIKLESSLNKQVDALKQQANDQLLELRQVREEMGRCEHWSPIFQRQFLQAKDYLQTRSYQSCRMEFGKGPFQIEFALRLPDKPEESSILSVELFPLEELPHTIHVFLSLIHMHMYDGTTFFASNRAQIEGGSPDYTQDPTKSIKLKERYTKFGFLPSSDEHENSDNNNHNNARGVLGINEYSTSFPHKEYTLGLSGRDQAGPGFFVNMVDNSSSKAPLDNKGDNLHVEPAIGKITKGHGVLKRIQRIPKKSDGYQLEQMVLIESVRLIR